MKQISHFLLVPDASAARRVRRRLVTIAPRSGVVVGTWQELVEQAKSAYLISLPTGWEEQFHATLASLPDPFWAESFRVSPQETATTLLEEFNRVLMATEPGRSIEKEHIAFLAERPRKNFEDLLRLYEALEDNLPESLAVTKSLLECNADKAIRHLFTYHTHENPQLNHWQELLIEKMNADSGNSAEEGLLAILTAELGSAEPELTTCLSWVQRSLYLTLGEDERQELDESLQWIGVRDYFEEAEVAAGMVQDLLENNQALDPFDIGILIPDSFDYAVAVEDAFKHAGLMLSGLPVDRWQRDLGSEALFHFIHCRHKPAPIMALAVCLSSPLMPWARKQGAVLAQNVMDGDFRLLPYRDASDEARRMLSLLQEEDESPETLIEALKEYVSLLENDDDLVSHLQQAHVVSETLIALLSDMGEIDWVALKRASSPRNISSGDTPNFNLEGVTVWRENQECWRPVKHLLVLGFSEGHYPAVSRVSSVFVDGDLAEINKHLGLSIPASAEELKQRRRLFKRQLAAVSETVSFLIPRRNAIGEKQAPSDSYVFTKALFKESENLILDIDAIESRGKVRNLPIVDAIEPDKPKVLIAHDIEFDINLLAMRKNREGEQAPESPSSLETLMVSPLAWLLRRLKAEPLGWVPESLDVKLLGTLAHQAFEDLFIKGEPLPEDGEINDKVPDILDEAIIKYAPFLKSSQWQVERKNLIVGITKAAIAWKRMLSSLDAEVLGTEEWLAGELDGEPIHGQADILLGLSEGRLLVVDYKRSSSNSRLPRMGKGYDSQASLYRTMLQSGGPKDQDNLEVIERLESAQQIGIVYYMLNDQKALSDFQLAEARKIPGWEALENDVASLAIDMIKDRLAQVKGGQLKLNRASDAEFFEKEAKVTPYALNVSPLVQLFTLADGEGEEE